jgi:methyltransferase (TIGR00027 family)
MNSSSQIEHISDTALWVAYYRAMESERPDALFRDPYASLLAGERGKAIVQSMPYSKSSAWSMITRTKALDEIILQTITQQGCDMVLSLAAGLDTRAYRLPLPASLRWIEVDLPGILSYKEEKLANEQPKCQLEQLKLDLTDLAARRALFERLNAEATQALVVTEGLIIYLTVEQARELGSDLHAQPHFRWWLTECVDAIGVRYLQRMWGKRLATSHIQLPFEVEDCEEFYRQQSWKMAEFRSALEEAHRLKREMPFAWFVRFMMRIAPAKRREAYRKMTGYALLEQE